MKVVDGGTYEEWGWDGWIRKSAKGPTKALRLGRSLEGWDQ